jgi:hypothetical protein
MAKHPESDPEETARRRDEVIKRMIAMPPKTHKSEPKRRPVRSLRVKQLPKHRTNKKRSKA